MPRDNGFKNWCCKRNLLKSGYLSNQNGIALVAGLVFMLLMTLLIFTAIKYSASDITRTKNYAETRQATAIAEAGIHRALNYFNYDSLGNSPGEVSNGFDDELDGSNWPAGTFTNIALGGNGGTYSVVISDNSDGTATTSDADNTVVLTSTGTISGVTAVIEAVIYRPLFISQYAILSEGDVKIAGSSTTIQGSNGAVHTNGDFTQSGGPTINGGANASGSCTGDQCTSSGAPVEFVPVIEPSDYEQYADYIFNSDGSIDRRNADSSITTGVEGNAIFSKFSHNAQGWSVGNSSVVGTSIPNQANLYFKDDFKATSVGDSTTPWEVSLIVEKSISWTGNAYIRNWKDTDLSPDLQNLFLIAGNDIKMSSMEQDTQGLIACKDQASLSGGANIEGYLISNNLTTSDNTVNGTETDGSGGLTLTYNGDMAAPVLSNKVSVLSWQQT